MASFETDKTALFEKSPNEHYAYASNGTIKLNKMNKCRPKHMVLISLLIVIIVVIVFISILIATGIIMNPFENESKHDKPGTFGKWSSYGGGAKNQQTAPDEANVLINEENVGNLSVVCTQIIENGVENVGYITVDDENNAYITNGENALKINLSDCSNIWSVNIAELIGHDSSKNNILFRHVATLFKNSRGQKGIIFGAPTYHLDSRRAFDPCFAIALHSKDGSLLWKTILGEGIESYRCKMNGFVVDGGYAYGGMAVSSARNHSHSTDMVAVTRGKMFKLDTNTGAIIHKWYSIDNEKFGFDENNINVSHPYIYRGVSMWHIASIIGDYLVTGTGNMWSVPKYIEDCLLGDFDALPLQNANAMDPCGVDRAQQDTFEKYWRCLEKGVYPSSFIVLNKHTFEIEAAVPLQGIDIEDVFCRNDLSLPGCIQVQGPDADLAAVATFKNPNDGELYGIAAPKSGHFYVFKIPSGDVVIAKKVGGWSFEGGSVFGVGVDERNMIAVVTITGANREFNGQPSSQNQRYKTILADGTQICGEAGSIHGIDLKNGETIWQIMNPFGIINDCNDSVYDRYFDLAYSVVRECERDMDGNDIRPPSETVIEGNVVRPPIGEFETGSALFIAPLTISGDLVFIPSWSGHVFIHNLFNGRYIHTVSCPDNQFIKGGVTVVEDRVIFHCGTDTMVSMQL